MARKFEGDYITVQTGNQIYFSVDAQRKIAENDKILFLANKKTHEIAIMLGNEGCNFRRNGIAAGKLFKHIMLWGFEVKKDYKLTWHSDKRCFTFCVGMTNREWINSLSDEQLVKLMRSFRDDNCCMCAEQGKNDCGYCYDKQVEWMEQEHDAERWEERDYRYSFW